MMLSAIALTFLIAILGQMPAKGEIGQSTHPMLYFSANEVIKLRAKASSTHKNIAQIIQTAGSLLVANPKGFLPPVLYEKFGSRWNEVYGNNLGIFSMYCLLYPDDKQALDIVKTYMDRMTDYPSWYVIASPRDEVPIGHSLSGFATAYDFLYPLFNEELRQKYLNKIKEQTLVLYNVLKKNHEGWTRQYIHNHAPTNIIGMLLGALVTSVHDPTVAKPWIDLCSQHLDTAMELLSHIVDGSLDEGVAYGSYSSRGFTQYVYLAKHHLNIDHFDNPWLKEHFWFFYDTVLPGFQRAVGIADSNHNWFYGPESQLVFLDAFVMRNGYGNWLADKIRRAKAKNKPLAASLSQNWCTIHTEFIFYDASLKPKLPVRPGNKTLRIFPDWGVVTYGGGLNMKKGNTFLSFKSGSINGEAMGEVMSNGYYPEIVHGWNSFNPGHEHPDQNSFVFAPNGRYFITEALYGPKYSYLDNVVLFAPSSSSKCNQPWEGQIGECNKWQRYKEWPNTRGEIVSAAACNNMVFIAGESVDAYSKTIKLSRVFRAALLLNPEVLVVVDSIQLQPDSEARFASAIFHNMLHEFGEFSHLGYKGSQIKYPEGNYKMFTMVHRNSSSPMTSLVNNHQPGLREGPTNYVNVTFKLNQDVTNVVHVFFGPGFSIDSASFLSTSGISGVAISLVVSGVKYIVNVATITRSKNRKVSPIYERSKYTGFGGYAQVTSEYQSWYFVGDDHSCSETAPHSYKHTLSVLSSNDDNFFLKAEMLSLSSFVKYLLSPKASQRGSVSEIFLEANLAHSHKSARNHQLEIEVHTSAVNYFVLLFGIIFVVLIMTKDKVGMKSKLRFLGRKTIVGLFSLMMLLSYNFICIDFTGTNVCLVAQKNRIREIKQPLSVVNFTTPFVLISSLPATGAELLASVFANNTDFHYISDDKVVIPSQKFDVGRPDLCCWNELENEFNSLTIGWFFSLSSRSFLHFNNLPESRTTHEIKRHMRERRNAAIVFSTSSGFWTTKIPWIQSVVGSDRVHPLLVIRDPRSWIYNILISGRDGKHPDLLPSLLDTFNSENHSCSETDQTGSVYMEAFERYRRLRGILTVHQKLAFMWTLSTATALYNEAVAGAQYPMQIVRFEDIITDPENTTMEILNRMSMPLSVRSLSKIMRTVTSGFFELPFYGKMTSILREDWKNELLQSEVDQIEEICCPLMKILHYPCDL